MASSAHERAPRPRTWDCGSTSACRAGGARALAHRSAPIGHAGGVEVRMLFQPCEDDLSLYKVLELALADARFSSLTVVVAWAKESGLRRIRPLLSGFRNGGGTARIILGIDAGGASV